MKVTKPRKRKCNPQNRKFSNLEDFKNHLSTKPGFGRKKKWKHGVEPRADFPKELTDASLNEDIADAAGNVSSYLQYHHRVGALVRGSLTGHPLSNDVKEKLVKDGQKMESKFQNSLQKTFGVVVANDDFKEQVKELMEYPVDMMIYANPGLWDEGSVKVVKALGVSSEEMAYIYETSVMPVFENENFLDHGMFNQRGQLLANQSQNVLFPEAPEHLEKFLVIGSNDNPIEVVTGAILATAGVLIAPFNPIAGGALIAAGGYMVIEGIVTDDGVLAPGGSNSSSNISVSSSVQEQGISDHWQGVASNPPPPPISFTLAERAVETYGYLIGNTNTKELHNANCPYLHLINPRNELILDNANEAKGRGYDNCHYCIGGSKR